MSKIIKRLEKENKQVTQENVLLLKECNMLRDENHKTKATYKILQDF